MPGTEAMTHPCIWRARWLSLNLLPHTHAHTLTHSTLPLATCNTRTRLGNSAAAELAAVPHDHPELSSAEVYPKAVFRVSQGEELRGGLGQQRAQAENSDRLAPCAAFVGGTPR